MAQHPTPTSAEINRITTFEEPYPRAVLGPHITTEGGKPKLSIRAFLPRATGAWVQRLPTGPKRRMTRLSDAGFFEAVSEDSVIFPYRIGQQDSSGYVEEREDPYAFPPWLTDYDLYLIGEGTHRRIYEKLGAHLVQRDGVEGIQFAVWAPNARAVCVEGNFNHWLVGAHSMNSRGASGIWELFVPRLVEGEVYKFGIKSNVGGDTLLKTDPHGVSAELRPHTGAVASKLDYHWSDGEWMARRRTENQVEKAVSIYEIHLGSWRRKVVEGRNEFLGYREIADLLVPYVKEMGFTHVELLPVMEHPLDDSWGYQAVNYYAPTSRYGRPTDLMYLIDTCHQNGIGVILDWVPAHFPKDDYGLALFDGTHLYNHADPRKGEHPDWGTLIFNYSRNEVRNFLIGNALFWLDKYHVDGFRIDAVASMLYLDYSRKEGQWIPNEYGGRENLEAIRFLKELNHTVHSTFPGTLMIAEESTAWPGVSHPTHVDGLGFDLKWNMGWMHDTLAYFSKDPLYRKYHQGSLTFSLLYAFSENFVLVFSHDEVVHGKGSMLNKMPGDRWQKFANLRLCYGYMFAHPGKKLLFAGSEFAQWDEWNFRGSLDWHLLHEPPHAQMQRLVRDLNHLYRSKNALHELDLSPEGFEWIDFSDAGQSVISYLRKSRNAESMVVVICNMTPIPRHGYRIGVLRQGIYREILNTDAAEYGGNGMGNREGLASDALPWHGKPYSLRLTLPPLSVLILAWEVQR